MLKKSCIDCCPQEKNAWRPHLSTIHSLMDGTSVSKPDLKSLSFKWQPKVLTPPGDFHYKAEQHCPLKSRGPSTSPSLSWHTQLATEGDFMGHCGFPHCPPLEGPPEIHLEQCSCLFLCQLLWTDQGFVLPRINIDYAWGRIPGRDRSGFFLWWKE